MFASSTPVPVGPRTSMRPPEVMLHLPLIPFETMMSPFDFGGVICSRYVAPMRMRVVGSSDLVVSIVGLGCNNFGSRIDAAAAHEVVDAAIGAGITFFDTAEMYSDGQSELFLGAALSGRREQVVIATKFGWGTGPLQTDAAPGSRDYIRAAVDGSLERLRTDYIDLYQYHRPDGITPIEETLGALLELVSEGKVREIGSSNLSAQQVANADEVARHRTFARFISAQNHYSWLEREIERDLVPVCEQLKIGLIPYFPLARGLLTGKYHRDAPVPQGTRLSNDLDVTPETWDRLERLESFATARGLTLLDIAIGGLVHQPAVTSVIAGATTPQQVRANASAGNWEPTADELTALRSL